MPITIALTGDAILNKRVSQSTHEGFHSAIQPIQDADVGVTQLETNFLEFDDPDAYPAAEAGGTWQRAPPSVAADLNWIGFNMISRASNHTLDYSYGGLGSTTKALEKNGLAHAGTGQTLGEARAPAYVETAVGRVALVSMASSFPRWTRAGDRRPDMRGRPGVNPLRYHHTVDRETLDKLTDVAETLGWWYTEAREGVWKFHPPALHNSEYTFVESDEVNTVPHKRDLEGNLRSIQDAASRADLVVAYLHHHEFDPEGDLGDPPDFIKVAARDAVDAGADVVVAQGCHSPLRGIEMYDGTPIFHDPGDFFRMSDAVDRLPADFYYQYANELDVHPMDATPSMGITARKGDDGIGNKTAFHNVLNPPGGYHTGSVMGNVVPVCEFDDGRVTDIKLHPGVFIDEPSHSEIGLPVRADGEMAERIILDVAEKSEPFDTIVRFDDGIGTVDV